jgi:hypothetical protein
LIDEGFIEGVKVVVPLYYVLGGESDFLDLLVEMHFHFYVLAQVLDVGWFKSLVDICERGHTIIVFDVAGTRIAKVVHLFEEQVADTLVQEVLFFAGFPVSRP